MRLTSEQATIIVKTLRQFFGERSEIMLFGSRVNDHALGGDIDLYIEPEIIDPDAVVEARLNALVQLHKRFGDQKIDLVINRRQGTTLPIYDVAKRTGVVL